MNKITFVLLAAAATLLGGCVVTSVYPFYFEKDVVFDSALLGDWTKGEAAEEHWKFERAGETAYRLTYTEDDKSSVMQARLFELRGQMFLDLLGAEPGDYGLVPATPSHALLRIVKTGPTLEMVPLDYDWLRELLETNPKAIRHHIVHAGGDKRLVLTADTAELQRFVVKHLNTKAAWKKVLKLKPDQAVAPPR
jgi:hypothetical protein